MLFIGWAFLKLGTAYRLAAGADFAHKLMGLGQTIGAAFADFAPGLAPFDWLVGIVGAVAFRLLIYVKSKNAKKFRRDAEYGISPLGLCRKTSSPFVDPKFENNMHSDRDGVPHHEHPPEKSRQRPQPQCLCDRLVRLRQNPVLAYPAAFAGQRRQISADAAMCVVDPKGRRSRAGGSLPAKAWVPDQGVQFSIDFTKSMHYNPLAYIRNEADILKFVDCSDFQHKRRGQGRRSILDKMRKRCLYCALIAYIIFEGPAEDRNMNTLG